MASVSMQIAGCYVTDLWIINDLRDNCGPTMSHVSAPRNTADYLELLRALGSYMRHGCDMRSFSKALARDVSPAHRPPTALPVAGGDHP